MPASFDQDLTPNAIVEFNAAKDHGKSDGDAWTATVARIRYDVLQLAIAELVRGMPASAGEARTTRYQCIRELRVLRDTFENEPDKPL